MKVLYIITLPDMGGAQVHLYEVISKLPVDIEPYIIIGRAGWLSEKLKYMTRNIFIIDDLVREISPVKDMQAIHAIGKVINNIQPDIVHCHSSKAGIVGRLAAKLAGVPSIFTAHGWAFTEGVASKKRLIYQWIEKFVGHLSQKIICVSDYDRNLALSVMPEHKNKLITIHNGVSAISECLEKKKQVEKSNLKLIMVARFAEPKNHNNVLKALQMLKKDNIPVYISFVGDGPNLQKAQDLTSELNLNEQVSFLGRRTDIDALLKQNDVFLLISNWEGFPISILEAMRSGLPVIASDVGGVKEAVKDNVTGFLIPRDNKEVLKEKIRELYERRNLCHAFGENGKKRYLECFTNDKMIEKIIKMYEEILIRK